MVFHEPLNREQVFAIEDAQDRATDTEGVEPSKFLTELMQARARLEAREKGEEPKAEEIQYHWTSRTDDIFLPAILLCVKEWHIERVPAGVTIDTFPMSPRGVASQFINWLWSALLGIYQGEIEIPNA